MNGRVYEAVPGLYLMVAPHLAPADPVFAVGWAHNDYWAVRVWGFDGNDFRNDYDPHAPGTDEPSLQARGWPHPLSYAETITGAKRLAHHRVMVSASHRLSDGGLVSHEVWAAPRVKFHYEDPNPEPAHTPVAVELRLGGPRWERHLAEIKAANRAAAPG